VGTARSDGVKRDTRTARVPPAEYFQRPDMPQSDRADGPPLLERIVSVTLTGQAPAELRLSWTVDTAARRTLERELFGKRVLVTDREDWPVAAARPVRYHASARRRSDRRISPRDRSAGRAAVATGHRSSSARTGPARRR
jgi:hypothetical protein